MTDRRRWRRAARLGSAACGGVLLIGIGLGLMPNDWRLAVIRTVMPSNGPDDLARDAVTPASLTDRPSPDHRSRPAAHEHRLPRVSLRRDPPGRRAGDVRAGHRGRPPRFPLRARPLR